MKYLFIALILVLGPAVASAEPVYLDCITGTGADQKKFSVKLDEYSGIITHTKENGAAFNAEGFFAPNTISYQEVFVMSGIKSTFKYTIDRNNLDITKLYVGEVTDPKFAAKIPKKTLTFKGSCSIADVKGRKI